jgi:hypothetical protein
VDVAGALWIGELTADRLAHLVAQPGVKIREAKHKVRRLSGSAAVGCGRQSRGGQHERADEDSHRYSSDRLGRPKTSGRSREVHAYPQCGVNPLRTLVH